MRRRYFSIEGVRVGGRKEVGREEEKRRGGNGPRREGAQGRGFLFLLFILKLF
jgi:hypothetical protein